MDTLAAGHDAEGQMIDTSIVRVHQHGACIAAGVACLWGQAHGGANEAALAMSGKCQVRTWIILQ